MSDVVIALEKLKKSVGKGGYNPKKVTSASVWGSQSKAGAETKLVTAMEGISTGHGLGSRISAIGGFANLARVRLSTKFTLKQDILENVIDVITTQLETDCDGPQPVGLSVKNVQALVDQVEKK